MLPRTRVGAAVCRALLCAVLVALAPAVRADVATPFPDYAQRRAAPGVVHEPAWSDVTTRPEAYRGVTIGYFLRLDGRIDAPDQAQLYCRNRAGEPITVLAPGGCRIGDPGDWLGVLGTTPPGLPGMLVATAVSRIATPADAAGATRTAPPPTGPTSVASSTSAAPLTDPAAAAASAEPVAPAPQSAAPAAAAQPTGTGPTTTTAGGAFQPPYEMVSPAHLAILERYITTRNTKLTAKVRQYIAAEIIRVAHKHGVRWEFFAALVTAESNFNPYVTSNKGAAGLSQLMPGTAAEVGVPVNRRYDIRLNLEGGMAYLRRQLNRYTHLDASTQFQLTLASYNAGPGAVQRHGGVPPYRETIQYIERISGYYRDLTNATAGVN